MRTVLLTGPGGSGASTVALATAQQLRAGGATVRFVTAGRPVPAALGEGLSVTPVSGQQAFEDLWGPLAQTLAGWLPGFAVPPSSSVVAPPGSGELALLAAVAAARDTTDVLVVDAGPLPQALTLLALPASLRWWLAQVAPTRVRVLGAVRSAAVRAGAARRGPVDDVLAALPVVERLLDGLTLDDPARTSVHVVLRPEHAALAEVTSAATDLALGGQRLASVTVNRVLPAGPGEWWAARAAQQEDVLRGAGGIGVPVHRVAEAPHAPVDLAGLRALDAALPPTEAPDAVRPVPVRVDGGWQLALALPHAARGEVELTRWADDLVVDVGGRRRSFPLDSLLRRCVVAGGRLVEPGTPAATLEVLFHPDAELWPAGLLRREGTPA
ncbi:ion transporter [Modestobacter sp. I12A-02628]|uniref:Ion transporter n=1 Tax=Goekera deserti TaxID=2497753 RepID=A0A7K3WAX3_9ACTN|nr:ArsA-related P-loop ATPase [Goekera deserti]MPQ97667.1 ion transporter [Goekera deserti]NDI47729.1 ion transporter [Goekera deserti]NEL53477.1 ion transporter [Goekera deserti]